MITCFTFKPNCYSGRFYFWFGPWDAAEIKQWYLARGITDEHKRLDEIGSVEHYDGQCVYPCPAHPLVLLQHVPKTPEDLGCFQHELHHAVHRFLDDLGVTYAWQSEEAYSYLIGVLTTAALDFVWHGKAQPGIEL